jgi:hypothetical protein
MPDFIVTIPKNYQRYLDSNIIRVRSDNASDAKNQIFRTLNIPAAIIDVKTLEEAGGAVANAATDLSRLTETIPQSIGGSGVPAGVVETVYISETGVETSRPNRASKESVLRPVDKLRTAAATPFSTSPFGEGEAAFLPSSPTSSTLTTPSGVDLGAENGTELAIRQDDINARLLEEQRLMDLDRFESEKFAREERERLANLDDAVIPDPVTMPANLPLFWKERYNEYLGLPGGHQQAILDNQLQNYTDLNDWQLSTGGSTGEEGGGVSGAAGANLTLQELEALAAGGTTGGGAGGGAGGGTGGGAGGGTGGGFRFQPGAFTGAGNIPDSMNLQGFAATGIQDMLNIFYSDPGQYIVEQDIIGTTGYDENGNPIEGVIGSQQSLSPAAQAALQAFSTQRGAESQDVASRFGTSTPFGAIAGLGGTSADAVGLAELQARAGVSNPYGALGTGSGIGDIGTVLRGGLSVEQQSALAGMQARGGLSAEEQLTLSGLQARGGLSAEQRLAEQRLGILPSLFQTTPQALGGLSRVLGGEDALQRALAPFFGGVPAQQAAPQQGVTANISGSPFAGQPVNMNIAGPAATQQPTPSFRPTLGDYQGAGMFEQGGLQAQAGMAGQELPKFLGEVSPQGTSTARGGLGAATTGRFSY